jgi:hypothetical protein
MGQGWVLGALALGGLGLGGAFTACAIFTGSTDGYVLADAGPGEVDGACAADGGLCLVDECVSAADCTSTSDSSPAVCCLGLVSSGTLGASCETSACQLGSFQLCKGDAECSGLTCVEQSCSVNGSPLPIKACGLVQGCTAIVSTDASAPDAADAGAITPDAGTSDAAPVVDSGDADAPG